MIGQTRFRPEDYEAGAAQLFIWFKPIDQIPDHLNSSYFMCFYRISELEFYFNRGHDIELDFKNPRFDPSLTGLTITLSV